MGAHTVDRDTDDTNKPLLNKENEAASCSQEDRCGDVEYDNEARRKAGASSLPESRPPPIHTHPVTDVAEHHEEHASAPVLGHPVGHSEVIVVRRGTLSPLVICPWCHRQGPTIQYKANGFCTWMTAALTCITGLWFLCPCVFCVDSLKDTVHYCSHCRRYLGRTQA